MEITSFILGVAAVITILMVVVTFMNFMELKNLQKQINILQNIDEAINRDLDIRERNCMDYSTQLDNNLRKELENLYRHVDSRADKLESKVYKDFDLTRTQSKSY